MDGELRAAAERTSDMLTEAREQLEKQKAEIERLTKLATYRPDDDEPATAEWVEEHAGRGPYGMRLFMSYDRSLWIESSEETFLCDNPTRRDVRELARILRIEMKE